MGLTVAPPPPPGGSREHYEKVGLGAGFVDQFIGSRGHRGHAARLGRTHQPAGRRTLTG